MAARIDITHPLLADAVRDGFSVDIQLCGDGSWLVSATLPSGEVYDASGGLLSDALNQVFVETRRAGGRRGGEPRG